MRRPIAFGAPLLAALLLVPAAPAAAPGTYEGTLVTAGGKAVKGATVVLRVRGERGSLTAKRFRVGCPYLEDDGSPASMRIPVDWRGPVRGSRVDATSPLHGGNSVVRLTGRFTGRTFTGRLRVLPAEGVAGSCTGEHRVRLVR